MGILFSIILGVGLAAACGFKVFVPFLIMSIASMSGHLELASGFEWIGTSPALIVFLVATFLEILAYYIPYIDNILDIISTPVAVISGILVTASCIQGLSPLFTWTLAVIVGGSVAGGVKTVNTAIRGTSTAATGGIGNNIVNTLQTLLSFVMSGLVIILPFLFVIFSIILIILLIFFIKKRKKKVGSDNEKDSNSR